MPRNLSRRRPRGQLIPRRKSRHNGARRLQSGQMSLYRMATAGAARNQRTNRCQYHCDDRERDEGFDQREPASALKCG
jgi:hypothetical protein